MATEEPCHDIRGQLDEHVKRLKDLIGVETIASEGDSADHLMRRVAEDCEKKRLFICCDGTSNNASGTVDPLTNVAKFARAIYRTGEDKFKVPAKEAVQGYDDRTNEEKRFGSVRQLVYYSSGVGTRSALIPDKLYAYAVGKGLSANMLDAYCFICNNYNNRSFLDEIILVGFSRGAFTVRCLAQFINDVGLLRRSGLVFLSTVFRLWRDNAGYKPDQGSTEDHWPEAYQKLRETLQALKDFIIGPDGNTPIKVLAEWDTVSAVGVLESHLSFIGTTVPKNVENAFHAVSIHEKRRFFEPMLWKHADEKDTKIKQCLFAGCHSDVGGGNSDPALSTASLFWMIGCIKDCCNASFDHDWTTLQHVTPFKLEKSWWPSNLPSLCPRFPSATRWKLELKSWFSWKLPTQSLRFLSFSGLKQRWLAWRRPILRLRIQSFAEGRVQESRVGLYALPFLILGRLWDGKRDLLWEEFLKQENRLKDGQVEDHQVGGTHVENIQVENTQVNDNQVTHDEGTHDQMASSYVNLTVHSTVRLLYNHRYKEGNTGTQERDLGLRCQLFDGFEPQETNQGKTDHIGTDREDPNNGNAGREAEKGHWRWVTKKTKLKRYLEEEPMTSDEKRHFNKLLKQARYIDQLNPEKDWTGTQQLLDHRGQDWDAVNQTLKWGPIIKGCVYKQTFISLLGHELQDESHHGTVAENSGPSNVPGGDSGADAGEVENDHQDDAAETENGHRDDFNKAVGRRIDHNNETMGNSRRSQAHRDSSVSSDDPRRESRRKGNVSRNQNQKKRAQRN